MSPSRTKYKEQYWIAKWLLKQYIFELIHLWNSSEKIDSICSNTKWCFLDYRTFYSLAKFYTTFIIIWWELNCFGCVAGLGLGRRPAFNSRPCFPSEGKGPNWDLGVRTLKLSSEDSEDKLGFWVSRKDHFQFHIQTVLLQILKIILLGG